jgi:hypothetical protein
MAKELRPLLVKSREVKERVHVRSVIDGVPVFELPAT